MPDENGSSLSPYVLNRRAACPGSYWQEAGIEEEASEYASRGAELHEIIHFFADGGTDRLEALKQAGEDAEAVEACIARSMELLDLMPLGHKWEAEKRTDCTTIHPGIGDRAKIDFAIWQPFGEGHIIDWKFTRIDPPHPMRNYQVLAYACALANEFDLEKVTVEIFLAYSGRSIAHEMDTAALSYMNQLLHDICSDCLDRPQGHVLIPSPDACRYCKAAATCPALQERSDKMALEKRDPKLLIPGDLASLLSAALEVEAKVKAVKAHAYKVLAAGGDVPGYALEEGRGRRVWKDGDIGMELYELAELLGKDTMAIEARSVNSPAQLEKVWGKSKPVRDALEGLIEIKPGKNKLVKVEEEQDD